MKPAMIKMGMKPRSMKVSVQENASEIARLRIAVTNSSINDPILAPVAYIGTQDIVHTLYIIHVHVHKKHFENFGEVVYPNKECNTIYTVFVTNTVCLLHELKMHLFLI